MTIFLTQRTRALTTLLNRSRGVPNGNAPEQHDPRESSPSNAAVRTARQKFEAALQVVAQTMGTARTIFVGDERHQTSLVAEVLTYVSTEKPPPAWVPQELRLTTQSLISSLPSSTHYSLLPSNIKGYRPYIDDASTSSSSLQAQVEEQMRDWFRDVLHDLERAIDVWLVELKTIREVWRLRSYVQNWLKKVDGLSLTQRSQLGSAINVWCQKRTRQVWKREIDTTKTAFREALSSTLERHREMLNASLSGMSYRITSSWSGNLSL